MVAASKLVQLIFAATVTLLALGQVMSDGTPQSKQLIANLKQLMTKTVATTNLKGIVNTQKAIDNGYTTVVCPSWKPILSTDGQNCHPRKKCGGQYEQVNANCVIKTYGTCKDTFKTNTNAGNYYTDDAGFDQAADSKCVDQSGSALPSGTTCANFVGSHYTTACTLTDDAHNDADFCLNSCFPQLKRSEFVEALDYVVDP